VSALGHPHATRIAALIVLLAAGRVGVLAQEPAPAPVAHGHEHVDVAEAALTPTTDTSGTAWQPRATPMFGLHRGWRGWDVRLDGSLFVPLIYEPGERHRTGGAATWQIGRTLAADEPVQIQSRG